MDHLNSAKDYMREQSMKIAGNKQVVMILGVLFIFICLAIYVYQQYVVPKLNPTYAANTEFINEDEADGKAATLMYFNVSWCPHCTLANDIWYKIEESLKSSNNIINGYRVDLKNVNCDSVDSKSIPTDPAAAAETSHLLDKYKIEGYPTIKLVKGNDVIEYNANTDYNTLMHFLNTVLK